MSLRIAAAALAAILLIVALPAKARETAADWTMGALLAEPATEYVLRKHLAEAMTIFDSGSGDRSMSLAAFLALPRLDVPDSWVPSLEDEIRAARAGETREVWSTRSPLVEMLGADGPYQVLRAHIPQLLDQMEFSTGIRLTLDFTLEDFLHVPESKVDRALLDEIQADLDKLNAAARAKAQSAQETRPL